MDDWMNNPKLNEMDPLKVELMKTIAAQSKGKKMNEMAPLLMAAVQKANAQGVSFTPGEFELVVEIMKSGKPAEEQKKIDSFVRMAQTMMKNQKKQK